MACVRKRRNKWVLDYRDQNGVRHWETVEGTRRDADELLAKRLQEIGKGEYRARSEEKTFEELAQAYIAGHVRVNVRDTTARWYEAGIRNYLLPHFSGRRIREITPEHIEAFRHKLVEQGTGRRTINKCLMLLSATFRHALRHRWVNYNPASLVRKLRDAPTKHDDVEQSILTPPELRKLFEAADSRYRTLIMAAALTGLRQGELLGLQWGDVDWNTKQVYVRRSYSSLTRRFYEPKTKYSRRRVDIPDALLSELKKWRLACPKGEQDLVFPNSDGTPEDSSNMLRRGFFPALRRTGLRRINFHALRHTYASLLIANKEEPKRMQTLLGHSSIKITFDIYGHLMPNSGDGVANRLADLVFGADCYQSGSKMVAVAIAGQVCDPIDSTQVIEDTGLESGSPGRTRTADPVINSHLLYRLSYRGKGA
jgi:integrase